MAKRKVIAYFMHEHEEAVARQWMPQAEATESYMFGDCEEADIQQLRDQGLIVQVVPEVEDEETHDLDFEPAGGLRRRPQSWSFGVDATTSSVGGEPAYYLVRLQGPLLEGWRSSLAGLGVSLLEHVPYNSYKALLAPRQVREVSALPFVTGVRLYDEEDTSPSMTTRSASFPGMVPPVAGVKMLTYDVRLHQGASLGRVRQWLLDRNVAIAGASGRKLRIYLLESSTLPNDIAALQEVSAIEQYVAPRLHNDVARTLLGIDGGHPAPLLPLTGKGQIVAVADTGLDDSHPDFQGRLVGVVALGRPGDPGDPHGHGTHVAGSVLGDGSASGGKVRGAAPEARLFFQSLLDAEGGLGGLPLDLADLFEEAYQAGARIHNNSWGSDTRSLYTINSIEVDEFVARRRDMLIVVSAGNDGNGSACVHAQPGFVDWLSIGSPASCKNALVVGASRSSRTTGGFSQLTYGTAWPTEFPADPINQERVSGNPEGLAAFSSRGPCDDRRIKPDLVAPGTDIASARSSRAPLRNFWGPYPNNSSYAFLGGTSMAAPLVAGCAALVRQYYVEDRNHEPSAALLKATLINGTRRLTADDAIADHDKLPNFHQGFGCVHLPTTLPNAAAPNLRLEFLDTWKNPAEHLVRSGQRFRYEFDVGGGSSLRLCLCWTDLPARGTQNCLSLIAEHLPTRQKWVCNADIPMALTSPDRDNNVQVIRIENPPAGTYMIQISATNLLAPNQDCALVVAGDLTGGLTKI
jgi:serine protease AprX